MAPDVARDGDPVTSPFDRICIVMLSAVGDAVHVLPVINAFKREYPMAYITWVIQPGPAQLVRGHPAIDEIIEVDPRRGPRALATYRMGLRGRQFDLLLDLQVAFKAGLVTALTPATVKLGFDRARAHDLNWLFTSARIPPHQRGHVQDQYFEFLAALRIPAEPVGWYLGPWGHEEKAWQQSFFAQFERPVASLVIGAGNRDREWMPERWAALADALSSQYDLEPVMVGGLTEREQATAHEIQMLARYPVRNALGSGLRRLVAILDGSALVVSLDTGPMHIAVALDRPVVSLMANADPRRTGPYRKFEDLAVDAFREPSDGDAVVWKRRRGRMPRITVDDVLARVKRWKEAYATISP
jgi:heptosyltransferase I